MPTSSRPLIVVALLLVLSAPSHAAAKWTRLQTQHFLFVGDAPERQIRQVAQRIEQFRDVMSRILPPAAVETTASITVFVFQNEQSLTPYKPRFEGRAIDVAGYFLSRRETHYVTMNAGLEDAALRIIFHEYAHFLVRNTTGDMPLWANEGLAELYETFEARDGGRSAMIGLPHPEHLGLLKNAPLMPLSELMAVDHRSPVYNEGDRRGVFYAESWALVHYLAFGSPAREGQLADYLKQAKNGIRPEQAFKAAFGDDVKILERELRDYIRHLLFPVLRVEFNERVNGTGAGRGDAMSDADANAYLGRLMTVIGRVDEARARLKQLAAANPKSAHVVGALGLLELEADNLDTALPLLEQAATLDPEDAATQRAFGGGLYARFVNQKGDDPAARATLAQARTALTRATELVPGDAEALVMLGHLESRDANHVRATALFERAVSIAPRQDRYRLMLADSLVRQEQYARATSYLGPLMAGSDDAAIKDTARKLLTFVANQRTRLDASGGRSPAAPPSPATPPPAARPTTTDGRFIPELRAVLPGEQRALGMFTTVDCRRGSIVLVIEADGETLHLATNDLAKVAFITYRGSTPGTVGCGPVTPASRVYATYQEDNASPATNGIDGRIVAIELLPDDFTPQ